MSAIAVEVILGLLFLPADPTVPNMILNDTAHVPPNPVRVHVCEDPQPVYTISKNQELLLTLSVSRERWPLLANQNVSYRW